MRLLLILSPLLYSYATLAKAGGLLIASHSFGHIVELGRVLLDKGGWKLMPMAMSPEEPQRVLRNAVDEAEDETASLKELIAGINTRHYARPAAEAIGASYAGVSVFIFQLLIGFALTNGTYLFFSDANGGLRPWNSYELTQGLAFSLLVAAATIRVFDFTASMQFNYKHHYPFRGGAALFLADSFLGITSALLFYVLSLTLAYRRFDLFAYLSVFGAILLLEASSAALNLSFTRYHRLRYLLVVLLNIFTIAAAVGLWFLKIPRIELVLLLVMTTRVLIDYYLIRDIVLAIRGLRQSQEAAKDLEEVREMKMQSLLKRLKDAEDARIRLTARLMEEERFRDLLGR